MKGNDLRHKAKEFPFWRLSSDLMQGQSHQAKPVLECRMLGIKIS